MSESNTCQDCRSEFTGSGELEFFCGECSATRHLPRCGRESIVPLDGVGIRASCMRPEGHTGHHTYGRRRA
jgi:hypothetical protein